MVFFGGASGALESTIKNLSAIYSFQNNFSFETSRRLKVNWKKLSLGMRCHSDFFLYGVDFGLMVN